MLAALRQRTEALMGEFAARVGPAYTTLLPYAIKAFHYGFIPVVILLGMRTEPRPKLLELRSPM
jgi:hypothetical protein